MSKRPTVVILVVVLVAVVFWLGGHAVWNVVLAMHGGGR
jgi:hypothetical protein